MIPGLFLIRQTTDCLAVAAVCVGAIAIGYILDYPPTEWALCLLADWFLT